MRKILLVTAIILACAIAEFSQAKPKFASVYSNFTTNCKNFDGENGSDGYSLCRGPGGYRIRVYYSAASSYYNAELVKEEGSNFPIAMADLNFNDRKTRVEWRTADGKPFAVIMRVPTYAGPKKETDYYGPVNGHTLVVVGLKGVAVDATINAAEPNANAKARELADAAYLKAKRN